MPEVISKHPDITLKVLQGAGARCGEGAPQKILTKCPQERFCSTPTGEVCVYGLDEISQMTQISQAEIIQAVSGAAGQDSVPSLESKQPPAAFGAEVIFAVFIALVAGAIIGIALSRRLRVKTRVD